MRTVIQKVKRAVLRINSEVYSEIGEGLLVLLGIEDSDTMEDIEWLVAKICRLRIFDDENGVMNRSVADDGGDVLAVSQFTLYASTARGNRPSYVRAAKPDIAVPLYERFCRLLSESLGRPVRTGIFGADMKVSLVNDGPVTIIMDSKNKDI